ncbi:unnamed protein product [Ectocarpus sp. CCAP 1310/34]|nr:unnamed protein product [Ectocarpus sp. CCAP 1310/34]
MPAASQNATKAALVNPPALSMRKHPRGPLTFRSARKRRVYVRVSLLARMPYARCHRDALSTNIIRTSDEAMAAARAG